MNELDAIDIFCKTHKEYVQLQDAHDDRLAAAKTLFGPGLKILEAQLIQLVNSIPSFAIIMSNLRRPEEPLDRNPRPATPSPSEAQNNRSATAYPDCAQALKKARKHFQHIDVDDDGRIFLASCHVCKANVSHRSVRQWAENRIAKIPYMSNEALWKHYMWTHPKNDGTTRSKEQVLEECLKVYMDELDFERVQQGLKPERVDVTQRLPPKRKRARASGIQPHSSMFTFNDSDGEYGPRNHTNKRLRSSQNQTVLGRASSPIVLISSAPSH